MSDVVGLLLAAGAGRRMGTPKGLLRDPDGTPWVARSARALLDGGCDRVLVVTGASAAEVAALAAAPGVRTVEAPDWAEGMGASLRAGLAALSADDGPAAAVVGLVDTPGVTAEVVARLVAVAGAHGPATLARAAFDGAAGHPVVLGREHWDGVRATAAGDAGARGYLRGRTDVLLVECGDVGHGDDVDTPRDAAGTTA
ncbi:NTP transferase domain-containing protein [Kineosporia sp. R_H_3]|uniref:nucleotidyltransferase family protein n=1 Tax=Kineosporia sp. R_H_3 TaxID=1961848 RepID=UPI000B4C03DC|nr:nucleotidyltransferase family protein [Kineosporia sp. R_H_3]